MNNVRGWWSEKIEGVTKKVDQESTYQGKWLHKRTLKIVEFVRDKKVLWLVTDNYFCFVCFLLFLERINFLMSDNVDLIISNEACESDDFFAAGSKPEQMDIVKNLIMGIPNRNQ